ncbi:transcription elongation factor GreA [Mannheimia haemolytica serotype A2 str. OVINE]|nr:transcription elongation factor GreA [Mannheimia haemolytica serotype A2 str. OVINE]EEY11863.1 transcription elongation factor GreA [Mannheimia haemolytica serotype A2 str. BOVINE]
MNNSPFVLIRKPIIFSKEIDLMKQIPMTVRGAEQLREELDFLKNVRRPQIIDAIAEAREHGDLKENAEYHAAREQQGFCEGRIQEIEGKLGNAQIIDVTKMANNGKVIFGATVQLVNADTDEEVTYRIVGDDEANIKEGLISVNSPIARGLIGKEVNDSVSITTPGGKVEFDIVGVEYI